MRLNHNMYSLSAYKTYTKTLSAQSTAMERISSGLKLNSAKDNPRKIGQSEQMNAQIKSLESANRNIQDGVSMIQTAEGGLSEISSMLTRMKELTVKASNGINSETDLIGMQDEIDQLKAGIDEISSNTEFNGVKILGYTTSDGTSSGTGDTVAARLKVADKSALVGYLSKEKVQIGYYNVSTNNLDVNDIDLMTLDGANSANNKVDEAIKSISKIRGENGAVGNRLDSTLDNLNNNQTLIESARSTITDADIASEMLEYSRTNILYQSSVAIIAQTNQIPMNALRALQNTM